MGLPRDLAQKLAAQTLLVSAHFRNRLQNKDVLQDEIELSPKYLYKQKRLICWKKRSSILPLVSTKYQETVMSNER